MNDITLKANGHYNKETTIHDKYSIHMKNYIITLLLAAMSLNGAQAAESEKNDTLVIPAEIADIYFNVYTSEDGNMSFYVLGGHIEQDVSDEINPDDIVCHIKTADGGSRTFKMPLDDEYRMRHYWIDGVHSIKKDDGTTFYIVPRYYGFSTSTGHFTLDAFVITGDTINTYEDGPYIFECSFDMLEMEYYPESKELYVPIVDEGNVITDHYTVYQFNGDSFVEKEGVHPCKGLHNSLHQYELMVNSFTTKEHFIRIDLLENGNYRYASWNLPSSISEEPDLILESELHAYSFRNGNYSYSIERNEDGSKDLVVKHNDNILTKEAILEYEEAILEYEEEIVEKRIPFDVAELLLDMNLIFDDGKISVFSLDYRRHRYCSYFCNIRTMNGGTKSSLLLHSDYEKLKSFHKVEKNNGSSYYIVEEWDHKNAQLYAFSIDNDTIKSVSIYDGSDDADNSCIKLFQENRWFNDEDYSLFEYDPISKELLVPEITEEQHFTDHYWVYRFNGERFEKHGLQPHKGLHSSLLQYKELVRSARTRDDFIRIDRLKDGSLRYAAWKISGDNDDCISREPEIVLYNGEHNPVEDYYTFRNGNYSYIIGYPEDDGDWHREFLIVKYQDKVIVKREIFN